MDMTDGLLRQWRTISPLTWVGLFIALFGLLIARQVVLLFAPSMTAGATICRESLHWLCAITLLLILTRGEHLPFSSVGIGTSALWRSILWGLLLAVVCAVV